jgi:hypothetical protein
MYFFVKCTFFLVVTFKPCASHPRCKAPIIGALAPHHLPKPPVNKNSSSEESTWPLLPWMRQHNRNANRSLSFSNKDLQVQKARLGHPRVWCKQHDIMTGSGVLQHITWLQVVLKFACTGLRYHLAIVFKELKSLFHTNLAQSCTGHRILTLLQTRLIH